MASMKSIKQEINGTMNNYKPQVLDFDCTDCAQEVIFQKFNTSEKGISDKEAKNRIGEYGYNEPAKKKQRSIPYQILSKFINPLVLVLVIISGIFILLRRNDQRPDRDRHDNFERIYGIFPGVQGRAGKSRSSWKW